eukprot:g5477.t1
MDSTKGTSQQAEEEVNGVATREDGEPSSYRKSRESNGQQLRESGQTARCRQHRTFEISRRVWLESAVDQSPNTHKNKNVPHAQTPRGSDFDPKQKMLNALTES